MKYIMFTDAGREVPIIFPKGIEHIRIAKAINKEFGIFPRSAGFVKFIPNVEQNRVDAICYGKSESLKLRYDEMDSAIIGMLTDRKD